MALHANKVNRIHRLKIALIVGMTAGCFGRLSVSAILQEYDIAGAGTNQPDSIV